VTLILHKDVAFLNIAPSASDNAQKVAPCFLTLIRLSNTCWLLYLFIKAAISHIQERYCHLSHIFHSTCDSFVKSFIAVSILGNSSNDIFLQ